MTTKKFAIAFLLAIGLALSTPRSSAQFTNINAGLPGVQLGSLAWGDFDNDGNLDLVLTGTTNGLKSGAVSQVWRNLGNGTFANLHIGLPGVIYSSLALGDFDNDGYLDILLTGETTNGTVISQIWRNMGNGSFTNINAGLPGISYGAVAWADYDNDGLLDILLTGSENYPTNSVIISQIWRNCGNGIFTNINVGLPPLAGAIAVAWADYDNDGRLDVLLAGGSTSAEISQLWRNVGNGQFTLDSGAGLPVIGFGPAVAWGDFDNDGNLDILFSATTSTENQVRRNIAQFGQFNNVSTGLPPSPYGIAAWGDYDGDGFLDILLVGSNSGISPSMQVERNLGNGSFSPITVGASSGSYNCSSLGRL